MYGTICIFCVDSMYYYTACIYCGGPKQSQFSLRISSDIPWGGQTLNMALLHLYLDLFFQTTYNIINILRTWSNKRTPILGDDRAHSELSNGGFGLKIGPFLTEIRPIL